MAEINDLNVTSASNTARWPEQMRVNQVNNAARDTESIIARWHRDTNCTVAVSGTDTYTATINADSGFALYDGFVIGCDFANANTGAVTINLTPDGGSALGAKAIKKSGDKALASGDIDAGAKVLMVYDGTSFQMLSQLGNDAGSDLTTHIADTTTHGATGAIVGISDTQTLTNKTFDLSDNTLVGTTAQFNTALSDGSFATLAGSETLTNKTLTSPTISGGTLSGATALTGTTTHGGNVVSDTDSTDDLGTTGVRWANLYVDDVTVTTAITAASVITGQTLEATGDTSAGDNSALGYTSAEGAVLTGQGSATDVTIKNDADAAVISVPTGTTNVIFGGDIVSDTDSTDDIGTTSVRWKELFVDDITMGGDQTIGGDLTVTGNLVINGTTFTNDATNVTVKDFLIEINSGASTNANDMGIIMERGSTGDNAIIMWDESGDFFQVGTTTATGGSSGNLTVADSQLHAAGLTLSGTSSSLGNVTTMDLNGGTIDGTIIGGAAAVAGTFTDLVSTGDTTIGNATGDGFTINPSAWTLANAVTVTGTWADLGTVTTANIDGGTIDGTAIGGSTAAAGAFTTVGGTLAHFTTSMQLATGATVTGINDTDSMSDASATTLPTSESIKAYVDTSQIAPGLQMLWETATTDTDQGNGKVWLNNSTPSSATVLYLDDVLKDGSTSINAWADSMDDPTHATSGTLVITEAGSGGAMVVFDVTGSVTSASTYSRISVTHVATVGTLVDGDTCGVFFARSGNDGAQGASGSADLVDDTTPQLGGALDPNSQFIGRDKGGDIASASPLVIDTDGDYFDVTGTTSYAAMTVAANRHFFLQFDGALTMTHHATNLDLPGEANITTAAGDVGEFFSTSSNTVQCVSYTKADGTAVVIAANSIDSDQYVDGSIDTAHLANLQVTTAKIAADAIDGTKLADNAVDSEHYTDGSIDNAHIADDAIDSEHYAAGSIDTAHLADDAVTLAKMASGTDGVIISYDASGNPVHIGPGSDGEVLTSTGAGSPPAFEAAGGSGGFTLGTKVATTSGTSVTFGSIPSGVTMIILSFDGVDNGGTNDVGIRLGDSGGIETSNYTYSTSVVVDDDGSNSATGTGAYFTLRNWPAAIKLTGHVMLTLVDSGTYLWAQSHVFAGEPYISAIIGGGGKALSGELTQVQVFLETSTFNAGSLNIMYQ